ncbi:MAG: MATE family efflux transporter [Lachnospiraceae bacterium]|nr:MATE family efflux transporter [Lachnospiraceae bacterium]
MGQRKKKTTAVDMTKGSIVKLIACFAVPLIMGNFFQLLYNTVDVLVVGNFVGKEALAAVGSTTAIINMLVLFFNGFSVGAGVVISHYYGAHDDVRLHRSIETTLAVTLISSVALSVFGVMTVPMMLRFMRTPDDVMASATTYLRIYFAGLAGLLIYNMGSGILRAVGDTTRPLMFLCLSSVLNIFLDLLFVIVLHAGIEGVAYATIISQMISAILVLVLLTKSRDVYRFVWKELMIDRDIMAQIMEIGLPAGVQSTVTAFSNVFVQSYINSFGSSCMAGWSCYGKMDQFLFLPIQSMGQAATTFVSQNVGAKQMKRAKQGAGTAVGLSMSLTFLLGVILWTFAERVTGLFSQDPEVLRFGVLFLRTNTFFLVFNSFNQVMAGSLRGFGDAKAPMYIMLTSFVVLRQIYLFVGTRLSESIYVVSLGYPVGWMACAVIMGCYVMFSHWEKRVKI